MSEDDPIEPAELLAVLGIGNADELMAGPFTPDLPDGRMRLSVGFGASVLAWLALSKALPPLLACRVAVEAANGATIGGTTSLLIAWRDDKPSWCWYEGEAGPPPIEGVEGFGSPLRRPMVLIPACAMLSDLAAAISARRERGAGATAH